MTSTSKNTNKTTPAAVQAMAAVAGFSISDAVSERIVRAIGPAIEAFAPVSQTIAFEAEPTDFRFVQLHGARAEGSVR